MGKLSRILEKVIKFLMVALLFGIISSTFMQVVSRYLFNNPFMWTEELARSMGIWCVMLGAGVVLKADEHLGLDLLPAKMYFFKILLTNIMVIVFCFALFPSSIEFLKVAFGRKAPAMQIPLTMYYSALPVGLFLLSIFAFLRIHQLFTESKHEGDRS
jgi:TRAP-type transport system small permease protein